jgi:hypothetical protein
MACNLQENSLKIHATFGSCWVTLQAFSEDIRRS